MTGYEERLIESAFIARKNSYSPYSGYSVGAALLCHDGTIVTGANIENASYGLTMCAERCAVFKAISEGKFEFEAIAICGGPAAAGNVLNEYAYPCGACRQVISEFVNDYTFEVIVARSKTDYRKHILHELFPESFGPSNL